MLFLILILLTSTIHAKEKAAYSRAENPCQKSENWLYGMRIPKGLVEALESYSNDSDVALEFLLKGHTLKEKYPTPESRGLIDYYMNRSYFDLGLIHLASRGFNALLNLPDSNELVGVRLAALGCMNQIHSNFPSIRLGSHVSELFSNINPKKIWPDQRKQLWEGITSIAQKQFSEKGKSADTTVEKQLLESSGPYLEVVQIEEAILQGNAQAAIEISERLLKKKELTKIY